jgi:hypothetical protein
MMRSRISSRNDLIPYFLREGNIHQRVAVEMTDLACANTEFRAAETVWMGLDPFPGE